MAEPAKKSKAIRDVQSYLVGTNIEQAIRNNVCVRCKGPANVFNNAKSEKEFTITGYCQLCQDFVYDHIRGDR